MYTVKNKGNDKKGKPILIATQQYVKIGDRHDNDVAILEGVKPGDEVVTSGQIKLHPDSRVVINNKVTLQ